MARGIICKGEGDRASIPRKRARKSSPPSRRQSSWNRSSVKRRLPSKPLLDRLPNTIKQLLQTRLLEGLPVKYSQARDSKDPNFGGTIRGTGIICSCNFCCGYQVWTLGGFEIHAGSHKKNAPENIYLENGNSLRDVLIACKDATVETMQEVIRKTIQN